MDTDRDGLLSEHEVCKFYLRLCKLDLRLEENSGTLVDSANNVVYPSIEIFKEQMEQRRVMNLKDSEIALSDEANAEGYTSAAAMLKVSIV